MEKRLVASRVLAVAGTVVLWLVVAAPLVLALVSLASRGGFRFDFLIPGEVFPAVLAGGALLVAAAILARARIRPIAAVLAAAVALLAASQLVAWRTGLAAGRIEAEGLPFTATMSLFVGYDLAVVALAVLGTLLVRDLVRKPAAS